MLNPQAENKNINIAFDVKGKELSLNVFGDIHAFKRVFINLISNSIKFTNENGNITCRIIRERNGTVTLEIEDNGIGIPENRLEQVLYPFEQVEADQELNEEGTGLGLSIVSNLIELHGGDFALTSKIGVGTKAIISIPSSRIVFNKHDQ